MHRKQRMRLVAGVVAGPLLAGACGPDSTAPRAPRSAAEQPAAVAAKVSTTNGAAVAIDDALTRLLGSLDAATSASLKGPLIAVLGDPPGKLGNRAVGVAGLDQKIGVVRGVV